MTKDKRRDPILDIYPERTEVIKFTAGLFRTCIEHGYLGLLRIDDIEPTSDPVTNTENWGLRNYLDFIGGPEIIGQTRETFEGLAELAKILTDIQSRIKACEQAIADQSTQTSFYKLMVNGNPALDSRDILSMSLRKAIETYATPPAFGISPADIWIFEKMLEPMPEMTEERYAEMRIRLMKRITAKINPRLPNPPEPA